MCLQLFFVSERHAVKRYLFLLPPRVLVPSATAIADGRRGVQRLPGPIRPPLFGAWNRRTGGTPSTVLRGAGRVFTGGAAITRSPVAGVARGGGRGEADRTRPDADQNGTTPQRASASGCRARTVWYNKE